MTSAPPPSDHPGGAWTRRRLVAVGACGALVAGVIALLVIGLANRGVGTDIAKALAAGDRPAAPEVTLPVLVAADGVGPEGAEVSLSSLRDRVVVVNFWASWCVPCRDEAPLLERVARRYRGAGQVLVLGIDTQDLSEDARAFVKEYGLTYPSLRDGGDGARSKFETTGVPETYVIDRQGRIAWRWIGPLTSAEQVMGAVEGALTDG